jgi:hypothetical protein
MSGHSGSGREGQDEEFFKVLIFLLITALLALWLLKTQEHRVNAVLGSLAYLHILPVAELVRIFPASMEIPLLGGYYFGPAAVAHDFLDAGGFAYMTPEQRGDVLSISGRIAVLFYGPVLIWVLWHGGQIRPDQRFRNGHTLESMIHTQTEDWITARIARHVNKTYEEDINPRMIADAVSRKIATAQKNPMPGLALPRKHISLRPEPWNRALRPEEWLVSKGVVFDRETYLRLSDPHSISKGKDFTFHDRWDELEIESISEVLAQQLRTRWEGIEKTKPIYRAVFSVMALFYNFDVKGGNALLNDIALISDSVRAKAQSMNQALLGQPELMSRIDAICSGKFGKRLEKHGQGHAYLETAFPSFLSVSRKDRGVLPAAAFLWLKAEDRLMWYILNNVGNEAIMVEAAGAVAHWRAEIQYGMKIRRPAVFQASRSFLEDYLDQMDKRKIMRRDRNERRKNPSEQLRSSSALHAGLTRKIIEEDGCDE